MSMQGLLVLVLICLLNVLSALPGGSVSFNCDGRLPSSPRYGSGGYKLHIEGSPSHYQPNRLYTVTLLSSQRQSFRAFHISVKSEETNESVGQFQAFNNFTSKLQDKCSVSNMVNKHLGKKTYVRVKWMSPASRSGCILLQAAVHEKGSKWYRAEGDLVTRICEKDINAPPTDSCCACGTATYRMKFYGIWSPQSHPKDYPKYSTHWSNVVGASHTPLYTIWQYGEKASDAVQQIAEWGFPEKMMHELRAQGEDVLTVVKTRAQWPAWPANGKFIPLVSNFDVDNQRFLVSLLTMLGPSPDWNVGISKESMCLSSCGWVGKREYFLTPWDAGTDDGVSYNSPNKPANPHHPIRPLNSTDHPDSPFYDVTGAAIPPLARMVIERVRIEGEQCGESEESSASDFDDADDDVTAAGDRSGRRCMYSEWFDWQPCSVSCGWGLKNRKRMVKVGKPMMCTDVMQTEICLGSGNCDNNENVTTCIYSEWTSWSRCSASCGESVRSRQRVMKWPSEPSFCDAPLKELVQCQLPSCDEACMYTPWSEWMICNATCGVGTTLRKRGLKIGNPEVCDKVMERSECMTSMSCHADPRFDVATCAYGRWSEWTPCPVECGAGQTFRKRMILNTTAAGGEGANRCESFQMESSKCMTSMTCEAGDGDDGGFDDDDRCELGDWSSWSTCSVTCGMGIVMRQRMARDPRGEAECSRHEIEKEICNPTPSCEETCFYQEWMEWMPCSVSCGSGWTVRKRFVDASANNNADCESFQMERNRCLVPCSIEEEEVPDHDEIRAEIQVTPSLPPAIPTTTTSEPEVLVVTTAAPPMTTTTQKVVTQAEKEEESVQAVTQEDLEVVDRVKPVVVIQDQLEALIQKEEEAINHEEPIVIEREEPVVINQEEPVTVEHEDPKALNSEEAVAIEHEVDNKKEPMTVNMEEAKAVEKENSLVVEQQESESVNPEESVEVEEEEQKSVNIEEPKAVEKEDLIEIEQEEPKLAELVVEEVTTPEVPRVNSTEKEKEGELLIEPEPTTTGGTITAVSEAEEGPQPTTTMCAASPWQEWSACSVTCGLGGHMTRTRSDPDAPECHVSETKSCGGIRRCPIDCQEGEWSPWRSCAKACSKNPHTKALTYRRRVQKRPKFGGKACGPRKEVRRCTC